MEEIVNIFQPGNVRPPQQPLTILAIDTEAAEGDPESGLLGTDFMFFTAFLGETFIFEKRFYIFQFFLQPLCYLH